MKRFPVLAAMRIFAVTISLVLIGISCNLPVAQLGAEIIPTEEEIPPTELVVLPPVKGDTKAWVDGNLLVYIPMGEFIMGGEAVADNPIHAVYLDGFWIYGTEVTNRMYWRCVQMGDCPVPAGTPSDFDWEGPKVADMPVVNVRWEEAQTYCRFVGGNLPTEAQWEKAARGPVGNPYPWGEDEPACDLLNFNDCVGRVSYVKEYPNGASYYDVLDMAGNVFEWVQDWYDITEWSGDLADNPLGPPEGEVRSVRGSALGSTPDEVFSALRSFLNPDMYRSDLGFRCVVTNAERYAPACEVFAYVSPDLPAENPNAAPGGSAACIVPEPDISVVTYCERGFRGNNISWSPADADITISPHEDVSCDRYDSDTFVCASYMGGSVSVEACKSCPPPVVQLGVPGSCDDPYVLEDAAGLCQYAGDPVPGADLCAPHYSLVETEDEVCCRMTDGNIFDYPACPIGGTYEPVSRICWFTLPSTGDEKCVRKTVNFVPCPRQDGGSDDHGQPGEPDDQNGGNGGNGNGDDTCPPEFVYCYNVGNQRICVCTQP